MFQNNNENENLNITKEESEDAVKQVFVNLVSESPEPEEETVYEIPAVSEILADGTAEMPETHAEPIAEQGATEVSEVVSEKEPEPAEEAVASETKEDTSDGQKNWYVIHTYSGYENKVRDNLLKRTETMNMQNKIFKVLVPTEEEIEYRDGKKRTVQKKIYPGYVLIEMIMSDDSWYVVRNTQGVTGFVGPSVKPTPVSESEIKQIMRIMGMDTGTKIKISLEKGQGVKIKSGPFKDFTGLVDEIYHEREKVKVLVFIFGRETPVELDFRQVEKL